MKKALFLLTIAFGLCLPIYAQIADQTFNIPASSCIGSASANAIAATGVAGVGTGPTTLGASNAAVFQVSTTASGTNTHTYTCNIFCPSRTTATKGCTINAFSFYYGVQTTALASQTAPACGTVTLPQPGTSETASTVTPVTTAVTVVPVIGSANLGTTTAGAFFTSTVFFTTPVNLNSTQQYLQCVFAFPNTATSATVTNTPGGTLFWTNNPI